MNSTHCSVGHGSDHIPHRKKNSYLILKFNFSQVSPNINQVETSFQEHADDSFFFFKKKYREFLDDGYFEMMAGKKIPHGKLAFLLNYVGIKGLKVYVMIDEYDNFTNTVLTTAGQEKYHDLTHGAGFFRFFFNVLKGAGDQVDSGISRMFITGVSPVTMDDVTNGFNIGSNISLYPEFSELLGFTEQDVRELLDHFNVTGPTSDRIMRMMREWYDGYRFSAEAEKTLFNTDMVLYFMSHFLRSGKPPVNMIDQNVRIDYGKLRHLIVLDKRLNGNFSYLTDILRTRRTGPARVAEAFPVERLTKPSNFISLLFWFGLLSYAESGELVIPNLTVEKLMYEYMREGYEDTDVFSLDFWKLGSLVRDMAYDGEWEPVVRFLAEREVLKHLFTHSPELELAYNLCRELTDILEEDISRGDAKRRIRNWKTMVRLSGPDCFDSFLKTLEKLTGEITNYFVSRQTGGFAEGLNNKIKVIKRRCYGIRNISHLFRRIFLDIRGYSLFARS